MECVVDCLVIADDLTGACDAGVHFAIRGYRTVATVSLMEVAAHVVAVTTDSRDFDPRAIVQVMNEVAGVWSKRTPGIVFKKIDSTLRGNPAEEIRAAMEAFALRAAVVTPAFPALGRMVRDGRLYLAEDPAFEPIDCFDRLGMVVLDAVSDADLDAIVRQHWGRRVLWAGSGGLAAALARALPPGPGATRRAVNRGKVVFCIGSDHKVTVAQRAALIARGGAGMIIDVARGTAVSPDPAPALFVTGGDTASAICRAIGATSIELINEIVPGLPWGILRGGMWDGRQVVTKSGGFGRPDALIRVADYFD